MADGDNLSNFWKMFPHLGLWAIPSEDRQDFVRYVQSGGAYGYEQWKKQGKPSAPTKLSAYAESILKGAGKEGYLKGTTVAKPTPSEEVSIDKRAADRALEAFTGATGAETTTFEPLTYQQAFEKMQQAGGVTAGYYLDFDEDTNGWRVEYRPPAQAAQPTMYPQPQGMQDPYGGQGQWNPYTGQWTQPAGWIDPYQQQQLELQRQQMQQESQYQQSYLQWQREQAAMQQAEQERQYKAQLQANPMSWLQYASYTGEAPVIQPWMKPLMSQQYNIGEAIPNWTAESASAMPQLTTPSAQLLARMGPTAKQQYLGYRQARTGEPPEEAQFRLWSQAPPGGGSKYNWYR